MVFKYKCAIPILLLGVSGLAYAFPTTPDGKPIPREITGTSIPLYLPLKDGEVSWFRPMTQSQLQITPITNITMNNIQITAYNSNNGTCSLLINSVDFIGSSTDQTVTLTGGHTYHTTDASNWAFFPNANASVTKDLEYQFRNNTTNVGNPGCIAAGGACNSSSDCGWSATRIWTP